MGKINLKQRSLRNLIIEGVSMRRICLLWFCVCLLPLFSLFSAEQKKTVCLNMIVKNESAVICRCLESVKPLIDYWVIVDTGSTDGTQKIIKDFMTGIPGELFERPWKNFEHNRNEAISLAPISNIVSLSLTRYS